MDNLIKKADVAQGKKTYSIVILAIILNVLVHFGYVDANWLVDNLEVINNCSAFAGLGTLYMGLTR